MSTTTPSTPACAATTAAVAVGSRERAQHDLVHSLEHRLRRAIIHTHTGHIRVMARESKDICIICPVYGCFLPFLRRRKGFDLECEQYFPVTFIPQIQCVK
jgi:hypothetical protein